MLKRYWSYMYFVYCLPPLLHVCVCVFYLFLSVNVSTCTGVCSGLELQLCACKFNKMWALQHVWPIKWQHVYSRVCFCACECCVGGGSGVWIISPWAIFRAASQAWGREEKGGIVVVQMSVVGASENRFTHGGLIDTHLQPPDPSECDHASWTPFPIMKGLSQYVAYVGCNWFMLQYDC